MPFDPNIEPYTEEEVMRAIKEIDGPATEEEIGQTCEILRQLDKAVEAGELECSIRDGKTYYGKAKPKAVSQCEGCELDPKICGTEACPVVRWAWKE